TRRARTGKNPCSTCFARKAARSATSGAARWSSRPPIPGRTTAASTSWIRSGCCSTRPLQAAATGSRKSTTSESEAIAMPAQLNHTIGWCRDRRRSSKFLAEMLGLPPPRTLLHFEIVDAANGVSLDFMEKDGPIAQQHYAFLVSDAEFDAGMQRIEASGLTFWADPSRTQPGAINHHFGGRGVYFEDPDGHLLELITRPYGAEDGL